MPHTPRPLPDRTPPRGVPRWLWPPPGAEVRAVTIVERESPGSPACFTFEAGEPPGRRHLRALQWLLDEHPRDARSSVAAPYEGRVVLEIARTALPAGRVGHAYALNSGPLGAPSGDAARGILWRLIEAELES